MTGGMYGRLDAPNALISVVGGRSQVNDIEWKESEGKFLICLDCAAVEEWVPATE